RESARAGAANATAAGPATTPGPRARSRAARRAAGSATGAPATLSRPGGPSWPPPNTAPDGEDEDVGADEEDDQPLDDQGQVAREVGVEDRRVELPRRRPYGQRAEQQRGEQDPDRVVPAEQRHRDAHEADGRGADVLCRQVELPAENVEPPGDAGEEPRDPHRRDRAPGDRYPRVAGCLGV